MFSNVLHPCSVIFFFSPQCVKLMWLSDPLLFFHSSEIYNHKYANVFPMYLFRLWGWNLSVKRGIHQRCVRYYELEIFLSLSVKLDLNCFCESDLCYLVSWVMLCNIQEATLSPLIFTSANVPDFIPKTSLLCLSFSKALTRTWVRGKTVHRTGESMYFILPESKSLVCFQLAWIWPRSDLPVRSF